ncbi:hypothetical protein HOB87_05695 [Candidatus Woesearchaeota archaeon]|nr:hypothetical protein [Candidatus Woesearchaeota archaeon]MBT4731441.1 hypothetical protein [Candidatus Woesearchaeota archaeon]MBT6760647.1 hypothetical protein [Candidatus Woesearchaeota archaeon]MBT7556203.1 hypothetical protein [Candidatus Woesearchaeota archaeon]
MKKTLVFLFLLIFACNLVFAQTEDLIQITSINSQISQGEVYQTEIILKNPINPLKPQDIKLYSSTNILQPLAPFLKEVSSNHYFLYFEVSQTIQDGDYTLKIEDQSFLINNILQQITQEETISIINSQPAIAITPGFFYLELDKQSQIQITAKSITEEPINFQVPDYITHPYVTSQTLNSNIPRTFTFTYDPTNASTSEIKFISNSKEYTIPLFVEEQITQETNQSNQTTQTQEHSQDPIGFRIEGSKLIKQINKEDSEEGNLYMYNKLSEELNNLQIKLTGNLDQIISLQQTSINSIQPLSNFSIYISINKDKAPALDFYTGNLMLYDEEYSSSLNIEVIITEESIEIEVYPEKDYAETETQESIETGSPVQDVIPWDLAGKYEEEAKENASPIVAIILPLLIMAILVFLLSGKKKKTKTKKFSEIIKNN